MPEETFIPSVPEAPEPPSPHEQPAPMLDIHTARRAASTRRDFFIRIAIIVFGLLIAVGLGHYRQHVPFPDVKDLATVKITLIRTRCYGTCPSYQVEVDGSGAVVFHGGDFVLVPGRHTAHVPEASVRELLEAFRRADYFSAKDSYTASVTDHPACITSLSIDGRSKKVIDYAGGMGGNAGRDSDLGKED